MTVILYHDQIVKITDIAATRLFEEARRRGCSTDTIIDELIEKRLQKQVAALKESRTNGAAS